VAAGEEALGVTADLVIVSWAFWGFAGGILFAYWFNRLLGWWFDRPREAPRATHHHVWIPTRVQVEGEEERDGFRCRCGVVRVPS
jgi:hypothetical protein